MSKQNLRIYDYFNKVFHTPGPERQGRHFIVTLCANPQKLSKPADCTDDNLSEPGARAI